MKKTLKVMKEKAEIKIVPEVTSQKSTIFGEATFLCKQVVSRITSQILKRPIDET